MSSIFTCAFAKLNYIIAITKCDSFRQYKFNQRIRITTSIAKAGNSFQIIKEMKILVSGLKIAVSETVIVCFEFKEQETFEIPHS